MRIEQLRHFLLVAKYLNISKAANELYLHQSTVSKSISALEEEIGGALLIRKNNVLELSPAGRAFVQDVQQALDQLDSLAERARFLTGGMTENLTISYLCGSLRVIMDLHAACTRHYPNLSWATIRREPDEQHKIWRDVVDGKADFGLMPPMDIPGDFPLLHSCTVYESGFKLVLSRDHPLAEKDRIWISDLGGQRILRNNSIKQELLSQIVGKAIGQGLPPPLIINLEEQDNTVLSHEMLLLHVAAGEGVCVLPEIGLPAGDWGIRIREIEDFDVDVAPFTLALLWRRDNYNPAVFGALQMLKELRRSLSLDLDREWLPTTLQTDI